MLGSSEVTPNAQSSGAVWEVFELGSGHIHKTAQKKACLPCLSQSLSVVFPKLKVWEVMQCLGL